MRKLSIITVLAIIAVSVASLLIRKPTTTGEAERKVVLKIDWVPSPEYYGIFYAKSEGLYAQRGLSVEIQYGTGAPDVAKELAVGSVLAGTTTSDNLLREIAGGARFVAAVPLLRFNPSVLAVRGERPPKSLAELQGRKIGVNKQSSVYSQYVYMIKSSGLTTDKFEEYPIGWGGAAELGGGLVDGILAYTTNVVVDLEINHVAVSEYFFGDHGVESYGTVLVIGKGDGKHALSEADQRAIIEATLQGYRDGADGAGLEKSVAALRHVAPTLNSEKVRAAIIKSARLNARTHYELAQVDAWLTNAQIKESDRSMERDLFAKYLH